MKKKIFGIIALMLAMIMALTSCAYVNMALDFIKELISPSVPLTDPGLEAEKLIDFKDGANPDVLFESDGWSNGDVFNVVWRSHNVVYENGIMRLGITEEKDSAWIDGAEVEYNYTAGEARTQNYYHYGDYEVSMKPSANPGTASTFFVCTGPYDLKDGVPNAHDEIDIEFLGQDTTHVQFNFFVDGKGGNEYMYDLGFDASEEFHTYGFRWAEDSITWFVDGVPVYKVTTDTTAKAAGNLRIVEKLPSTAGRILTNYWCGNERAWGWMGRYVGATKDNGTTYQWIATSAEGAPLNPPAVNPPAGGGEDEEINWADIAPISPEFPDAAPYDVTVEGTKATVTYTDVSGSAYMPIELDVTDAVAGKNYVYLKVTNNGTETVNVRVNMFDPTLTGNNKATNISATMNGVAVRTDLDWGGSFFDIPAGETAELVVHFGVGGVKLQLMIDSSRNDSVLRSGSVTVEDIKFAAVGEVQAPHKCEDLDNDGKCDGCGENMPAPPAPTPDDPTSGNLTTTINGEEFTFEGNVADGYGVNVADGVMTVEYTNIVGNSYKNIWATVSSVAGTRNTFTMKVTNNGTEAVKVRIDIESQTQVTANTTCCNVSATQDGEYAYTDLEWGGSTFVIEAGATATLEVVYDASKTPTNLKIFVDSCQWDDSTAHAGNITISEMEFKGETPVEPSHECEHVCAECGMCLDTECQESACEAKCQGHEPVHTCQSVCADCGKCENIECEEAACAEKCECPPAVDPVVTPPIVNISDLEAGTTTGEELIAGTGIFASEGLAIDANKKSIDGFDFTLRLKLGGTMKVTDGVVTAGVKIVINGAAKIVVYGMSSSSSATRTLRLTTLEDGTLVDVEINENVAGDAIGKFEFTAPAAGTYYLGSKSSGINIYYIEVVYDENEEPVHECKCPCEECGKCTDEGCFDEACLDKCEGHFTFEVGEYLNYAGNDCYTFDSENYLEAINVTYENVSTNTYQNINAWVKDKAEGHSTLRLYIVNNGSSTVYVTVKLETAGTGLGETKIYVDAGQVGEVNLDYVGSPEMLYFFIDTGWSETTTSHAGDITIRGIRFEGEGASGGDEPVAPPAEDGLQLNFWTSNSSYTANGHNIKYSGTGSTYACAGSDVSAHAAGKTTFTITITNNGAETARVRVDVQGTTTVGNHNVLNTSATGGDVWTDMEWGGSTVTVAAGESVTLVITYDDTTDRGAVTNMIVFVDSARGDSATYNSDVTLSGMSFN